MTEAVTALFAELDGIEAPAFWLALPRGRRVTEAVFWRLFTTLVRFDPVYHGHFKCNRRRIVDYPPLWAYTRELYQWPGVAETVIFDHITRTHHYSHERSTPHRMSVGPVSTLVPNPFGSDGSGLPRRIGVGSLRAPP